MAGILSLYLGPLLTPRFFLTTNCFQRMCLTIDVKAMYGGSLVPESLEPFTSTVSVKIPGKTKPIDVEEAPVEVEAPQLNTILSFGKGNVETTKSNAEFTILLVGETGTGKTSFLSLLVNVLAGRAPDEYDLEPYDVTNESGSGQMHSQTNAAKVYKFKSVNGVQVTVLDTPGLADTRGLEKDNEKKCRKCLMKKDLVGMVPLLVSHSGGLRGNFLSCIRRLYYDDVSLKEPVGLMATQEHLKGAVRDMHGIAFGDFSGVTEFRVIWICHFSKAEECKESREKLCEEKVVVIFRSANVRARLREVGVADKCLQPCNVRCTRAEL
ncbi:hypothetical protein K443DRAFT_15425 [Laccaria amethystina LaAM-08-1]|uniref:G domain-containing protein n=1 Tax=Laccaria amethystina LaAM-08-1 TaxID=1095629 RepID=A0A0C9WQY2_9AGAR|nr:hypothetical protein K443DRAFT_15425 [Laccaria amethystina LaAM-08-1]